MLVSCNTSLLLKYFDTKEAIKLIKEAGFEAFDISVCEMNETLDDNYLEIAKNLRKYADSLNIVCNQAHATYPTFPSGTFEGESERVKRIKREIEFASILGAKVICIHPLCFWGPEENAKMFNLFKETAIKNNIKIGIENMFTIDSVTKRPAARACNSPESFTAHLNALDNNVFVGLLDIGHAEAVAEDGASKIILALGNKRLQALHIHDNNKISDLHAMPYTQMIDFDKILNALKEINYNGDITFEAERLNRFPKELVPYALKLLAETGKYFRTRIQN